MLNEYDIVIIGGGPSGIAAGIEAHNSGFTYIILEKGYLVNTIYNFPINMTFFSTSLKLEIGDTPFISHVEKPTRKEALEYYRRVVESYNLNIRYRSEVRTVVKHNGDFYVEVDQYKIKSNFIIVATGYFDTPRKLNVKGEEASKVKHYYDDAHPYIGMNVIVVGAANSACDVALETWQKGANVTMVIRGENLYSKVKYWILPNIKNRINEGSIKAYFNSEIKSIEKDKVLIETPNGIVVIDNDYVLAMTGYKPNYDFIKSLGIEISKAPEKKPLFNSETLETNVSNMYIAGVIAAGLNTSELFIENTRDHGKMIISSISSKIEFLKNT